MTIHEKIKIINPKKKDLFNENFPIIIVDYIRNESYYEVEGTCLTTGEQITSYFHHSEIESLQSSIKAITIIEYYKIYISYLHDHELEDKSKSITVEQLIDFVENHILNN